MVTSTFETYSSLGIHCIPIEWDTTANAPAYHPKDWQNATIQPNERHNGLMIHTDGEWGCIDFDLKNTEDKTVFDRWMAHVQATMENLLSKVYIEQTRSGGYHVFIRYDKLPKKQQWAQGPTGQEVIALYANGPLIYTWPTPGYNEVHQSMEDVELLNDAEFNYLVEVSQFFNEYQPEYDPNRKAVSYPVGFEKYLTEFDIRISNEAWEAILSGIGLHEVQGFRYRQQDKFRAFKRQGSECAISAKVYYRTKRVLIFSASMVSFPNWHTKEEYPIWSLPPSFVLYYQHGRDWPKAMKHIERIALQEGIGHPPVTEVEFPMHVFPAAIRASILEVANQRSLPPQFLASACIWGASALAGNAYINERLPEIPNILYMLFIAPVSVGKSPAIKTAVFEPLKKAFAEDAMQYKMLLDEWKAKQQAAANKKKAFVEPRPLRYLPLIQDGTTESFLSIHLDQPAGIGVAYEEAETLFNAGNYKAVNDAVTFLTTIFSGGPYTQTRANRELERVIPDVNINIVMCTQPERTGIIFNQDKIDSGFAARFLPVVSGYIKLNEDADPMSKGAYMCREWRDLLTGLYNIGRKYNEGAEAIKIQMTDQAVDLYRQYYRQQLKEANQRIENRAHRVLIGLGAKMSSYMMRLTQVLAIIQDNGYPVIDGQTMQNGIDLFNYYYKTAETFIMSAMDEAEIGLPAELATLYEALPDSDFTREEAVTIAERLNLEPRKFEKSLRRKDFKALFRKVKHGVYCKI